MIIAHKHHGIIIDRVVIPLIVSVARIQCRTCDSVAYRGVNHLIFSGDGIAGSIGVFCSTTHVGDIVSGSHCRIIHLVGVWISQVDAFCPIRLDGDGRHPFGYIPICTLVENTVATTIAIKVLVGAVAVGKIIGR